MRAKSSRRFGDSPGFHRGPHTVADRPKQCCRIAEALGYFEDHGSVLESVLDIGWMPDHLPQQVAHLHEGHRVGQNQLIFDLADQAPTLGQRRTEHQLATQGRHEANL